MSDTVCMCEGGGGPNTYQPHACCNERKVVSHVPLNTAGEQRPLCRWQANVPSLPIFHRFPSLYAPFLLVFFVDSLQSLFMCAANTKRFVLFDQKRFSFYPFVCFDLLSERPYSTSFRFFFFFFCLLSFFSCAAIQHSNTIEQNFVWSSQ